MALIQRVLRRLLPNRLAEQMEAESRSWHLRCECGAEVSVWDIGGVRWKAKGNPRYRRRCDTCDTTTWHVMIRHPLAPG